MKPHIYKSGGVWFCKKLGTFTGIGYTPRNAYLDWKYTGVNI